MKIEHLFLFIIYLLSYQTSLSQQNSIDSLERLLPNLTSIDKKITIYQALILESSEIDTDKAMEYRDQIIKLLPFSQKKQRGNIYYSLLKIYANKENYEQVIFFSDSALHYLEPDDIEKKASIIKDKKWKASQKLAFAYLYRDLNKANEYASLSIKVAFENNDLDQIGRSYCTVASVYSVEHHTESALLYFDSSIYYLQQTNNQKELARVYNNIGNTNCMISNYSEASKWLYKSLETYDSLNLPSRVASTLDALASIDTYLKDYPEAIKKISKAIDLHKKNDNLLNSLISTLNLGNIYCHAEEWEKAIPHLDEAIPLLKELNQYGDLIYAYSLKADALKATNQLDLAQQSIAKALELKKHTNNKLYLLGMYNEQAELFFLIKDYPQSIASFNMILDSAKQIPNLPLQLGALKGLMNNYLATNNFKKAYEYSTKVKVLNDSLTAQNNQKNIKDIEIKYNTEKKEQENKLLLKEQELQQKEVLRGRQFLYLSIGIAFLIFIISFLILRQYKTNATATNNELKSKLLRNQMSPHFLFNSLVAIQSFVYTNNPIKAGDYLSSFAALMRAILDNSSQEYITITKELQWLENYLSLQLLRFKDKFEYHIHIDEHINLEYSLIPPMLIQPFIENAIEHGLKNLDKKGLLSIYIQQQEDTLFIKVKDNGLGISALPTSEPKTHQSRALTITQERLQFLNKKLSKKIVFDIKSNSNDGTIISFQIPFKSKF